MNWNKGKKQYQEKIAGEIKANEKLLLKIEVRIIVNRGNRQSKHETYIMCCLMKMKE
jgi:hypothetical protein